MQAHYRKGRPKRDTPGFRMSVMKGPTPFSAGMITFASNFTVIALTQTLVTALECPLDPCYRS